MSKLPFLIFFLFSFFSSYFLFLSFFPSSSLSIHPASPAAPSASARASHRPRAPPAPPPPAFARASSSAAAASRLLLLPQACATAAAGLRLRLLLPRARSATAAPAPSPSSRSATAAPAARPPPPAVPLGHGGAGCSAFLLLLEPRRHRPPPRRRAEHGRGPWRRAWSSAAALGGARSWAAASGDGCGARTRRCRAEALPCSLSPPPPHGRHLLRFRRPMDAISKLSAAATSSQRPPRLLPMAAAARASSSSSTRRRRASPQAGLPPSLGAAASTQLPPAVRLPSSPLGRAPAAAAHPRPGGRVGKREEEPRGAMFWWLRLPSESPKLLHVQLRGWSCCASTPLAGLRPEPALKPLLEPCQRGPYYECRGCKVGTIVGVERKIKSPRKLEEPLLKKYDLE